jgi:hypothetical protein
METEECKPALLVLQTGFDIFVWRGALVLNKTGALDIAELVSNGIDAALEFIGVSVTEEKADKPAEKPKRSGGRFAVEVNGLRLPPKKARKRKSGKTAAAPAATGPLWRRYRSATHQGSPPRSALPRLPVAHAVFAPTPR